MPLLAWGLAMGTAVRAILSASRSPSRWNSSRARIARATSLAPPDNPEIKSTRIRLDAGR